MVEAMISLEMTDYGFRLTFVSKITKGDVDPEGVLGEVSRKITFRPFSAMLDMTELMSIEPAAWEVIKAGRELFRENGLARSALIFPNRITLETFQRMTKPIPAAGFEKVFVTEDNPTCYADAEAWLRSEIEPAKAT